MDALTVLREENPVVEAAATPADELLLDRIRATPVTATHAPRRPRRRLVLVAAGLLVVVAVGFRAVNRVIGQDDLPAAIEIAREGIPLPPGVEWSDANEPRLRSNEFADEVFARQLALGEATCRWERVWIDAVAAGDTAAAKAAGDGYSAVLALVDKTTGMADPAAHMHGYAEAARAGDTGALQNDLAVNCRPEFGGMTAEQNLDASLRMFGTPAVALVSPLSNNTIGTAAEDDAWIALAARWRAALAERGLSVDRSDGSFGNGLSYVLAADANYGALLDAARAFAANEDLPAGSYIASYRPGDADITRTPLG